MVRDPGPSRVWFPPCATITQSEGALIPPSPPAPAPSTSLLQAYVGPFYANGAISVCQPPRNSRGQAGGRGLAHRWQG